MGQQGKCWTKWQPAESRIVWDNQDLKCREIAELLESAGYARNANMVRSHLNTLKRREAKRLERQQRPNPFRADEQARYRALESIILEALARIEAGELRPEVAGDPTAQAVDIVLKGCRANPGILDELIAVRRERRA